MKIKEQTRKKIKEQTRKLAAGCESFEVVDKTDEVSNLYTAR
ncbi:hypothetical protein [Streptococcus pneumoniae]|nr:hypothetical protein [Streptococcus pneumoniae]